MLVSPFASEFEVWLGTYFNTGMEPDPTMDPHSQFPLPGYKN